LPDLPRSAVAVGRAVALAGPDATVRETLALAGGTHARTYLIRTADPDREFVLREFPAGDDGADREMRVLAALDGLGGLAPRLLAGRAEGQPPDGPWTLISRLPGSAGITPDDPAAWARQLGVALARVHATDRSRVAGFPRLSGRVGGSAAGLGGSAAGLGGSAAGLGGPAAGLVAKHWEALWSGPEVLTHYDFWSGNTVWQDGILTGVVDWPGAALGPAGYDLGWGRLDLVLLFDEAVASTFGDSYGALPGGLLLADLWAAARSHDIVETWEPNYRELGRADLTARELRRRHTAWTGQLIERWTAAAG
jgi:aminoglycoside phosphotransferase (APT) family kinase protein